MIDNDILHLIIYLLGGFVIGFIIHKWIMPLIAKLAAKTNMKSDDLIINAIKKWVILWCVSLGLFFGLKRYELPVKYQDWIEKGLMVFFIFSATIIVATIISGLMRIKAKDSDTIIPSSSIIGNIVRVAIYCIGLIIVLQSLGISVTPLLTALGVGGLAVALALQNTLSNLFAGLQIIASGKINQDDFVKLASGEEGFIQDITWRSTTIKAVSDHIIIVPNSKLADMIVLNYYLPYHDLSFGVEVGVGYESDLNLVEKVTLEVIHQTMQEVEGGIKDYEPVMRFTNFGDSNIGVRAILRVAAYTDQFSVKHEFIKRLHVRFQQEGINIPFPIRTVLMKKDGEV